MSTLGTINGSFIGSNLTTDGILYADSSHIISSTSAGNAGEVLTSNGTGVAPTFQAASAGGLAYTNISGTTQAMDVNTIYIVGNASQTTATLPSTAAVGSVVGIIGKGAGGWIIAQNSGQTIHFGNQNTTTGASGSLTSTNQYDSIELVCVTADTDWVCSGAVQGNITVA